MGLNLILADLGYDNEHIINTLEQHQYRDVTSSF